MWAFVETETGRILAIGSGPGNPSNHDTTQGQLVALPPQDISGLYEPGPGGTRYLRECYYPADVRAYTPEERSAQIDAHTFATIGASLHPTAPVGEQLAIHREQLAAIMAALSITPTGKFATLQTIAAAAVAAAQLEKETP